ncbi:MAG: hypothetical protein ACREPN_04740 [Rudaea sp.]
MQTSTRRLAFALGLSALSAIAANTAAAADHQFMLTSPFNAVTPFDLTLPSTTEDGKPAKIAVIKFVSADCQASAGVTTVGSAQLAVLFNGQNGFYRLPFPAPAVYSNGAEYTIAQQTLIFADAGSTINFGLSDDSPPCYVVISGNLTVK